MTMNISSVAGNPLGLTELRLPKLATVAKQLLAMVTPPLNPGDLTQEAIEVLSGTAANLDMREWAERYLCGMEPTNAKRPSEFRRAQS